MNSLKLIYLIIKGVIQMDKQLSNTRFWAIWFIFFLFSSATMLYALSQFFH